MNSYREGCEGCHGAVIFFIALNKLQQSMQGDPSARRLSVLVDFIMSSHCCVMYVDCMHGEVHTLRKLEVF